MNRKIFTLWSLLLITVVFIPQNAHSSSPSSSPSTNTKEPFILNFGVFEDQLLGVIVGTGLGLTTGFIISISKKKKELSLCSIQKEIKELQASTLDTYNLLQQQDAYYLQQRILPPGIETELSQDINRLTKILSVEHLDNFQGTVNVNFLNQDREKLPFFEGLPMISQETSLQLEVEILELFPDQREISLGEKENITEDKIFSRPILIKNGEYSEKVTFDIRLDSDTIVSLEKKSITIQIGNHNKEKKSNKVVFDIAVPKGESEHKIWVEIFQKNKFIQVIPTKILVMAKTAQINSGEV